MRIPIMNTTKLPSNVAARRSLRVMVLPCALTLALTGPPPPMLHRERSRFPAGPVECAGLGGTHCIEAK
jgi:hypothetical protein